MSTSEDDDSIGEYEIERYESPYESDDNDPVPNKEDELIDMLLLDGVGLDVIATVTNKFKKNKVDDYTPEYTPAVKYATPSYIRQVPRLITPTPRYNVYPRDFTPTPMYRNPDRYDYIDDNYDYRPYPTTVERRTSPLIYVPTPYQYQRPDEFTIQPPNRHNLVQNIPSEINTGRFTTNLNNSRQNIIPANTNISRTNATTNLLNASAQIMQNINDRDDLNFINSNPNRNKTNLNVPFNVKNLDASLISLGDNRNQYNLLVEDGFNNISNLSKTPINKYVNYDFTDTGVLDQVLTNNRIFMAYISREFDWSKVTEYDLMIFARMSDEQKDIFAAENWDDYKQFVEELKRYNAPNLDDIVNKATDILNKSIVNKSLLNNTRYNDKKMMIDDTRYNNLNDEKDLGMLVDDFMNESRINNNVNITPKYDYKLAQTYINNKGFTWKIYNNLEQSDKDAWLAINMYVIENNIDLNSILDANSGSTPKPTLDLNTSYTKKHINDVNRSYKDINIDGTSKNVSVAKDKIHYIEKWDTPDNEFKNLYGRIRNKKFRATLKEMGTFNLTDSNIAEEYENYFKRNPDPVDASYILKRLAKFNPWYIEKMYNFLTTYKRPNDDSYYIESFGKDTRQMLRPILRSIKLKLDSENDINKIDPILDENINDNELIAKVENDPVVMGEIQEDANTGEIDQSELKKLFENPEKNIEQYKRMSFEDRKEYIENNRDNLRSVVNMFPEVLLDKDLISVLDHEISYKLKQMIPRNIGAKSADPVKMAARARSLKRPGDLLVYITKHPLTLKNQSFIDSLTSNQRAMLNHFGITNNDINFEFYGGLYEIRDNNNNPVQRFVEDGSAISLLPSKEFNSIISRYKIVVDVLYPDKSVNIISRLRKKYRVIDAVYKNNPNIVIGNPTIGPITKSYKILKPTNK